MIWVSCRNPWKKIGSEKKNSVEMKMLENKEQKTDLNFLHCYSNQLLISKWVVYAVSSTNCAFSII